MTTKSLSCLVLAVVLGTATTVRWYLDAEDAAQAARLEGTRPAMVYQHLPLPMRAETARFRFERTGSAAASEGSHVELSGSGASHPMAGRPCVDAATTAAEPTVFGVVGSGT